MTSGINKSLKNVHIAAILNVCRRGDYEFLENFIKAGGDLSLICDDMKRNCLIYCSEGDETNNNCPEEFVGGRLKCAELLVKSYPKIAKFQDCNGMSVIHHCVAHENFPLLKLLKSKEVDLSQATGKPEQNVKTSVYNRNIIHLSVIYAKDGLLEKIITNFITKTELKPIDVNLKDSNVIAPLHYSVQQADDVSVKMIKSLIKIGKADIEAFDSHKRTPLIWAMTVGNVQAVRLLLKFGANYKHKDLSGITPLHCAASRGFTRCVVELCTFLKRKTEVLREICNYEDLDGCTPLFYSVTMGNHMITEKLLEVGANIKKRDKKLRTVLHCATRPQDSIIIIKQFQLLIANNVEIWSKNVVGENALHEACLLGNEHFVNEITRVSSFLEHIDDKTYDGKTAIMIAVESLCQHQEDDNLAKSYLKIIELLLKNNCDLKTSMKILDLKSDDQEIIEVTALNQLEIEKNPTESIQRAKKMIRDCGGKTFDEYHNLSVNNSTETFREVSELSESQEKIDRDQTQSYEDNAVLDITNLPSSIISEIPDKAPKKESEEKVLTKDASTFDILNDQSSTSGGSSKKNFQSMTNDNVESIRNSSSCLTDKSANTSVIDKINVGIQSDSRQIQSVDRLKSGRTRVYNPNLMSKYGITSNFNPNPYLDPLLPQSAMVNRTRRIVNRQNCIEPVKGDFLDKTIFCYCQCRHGNIQECRMNSEKVNGKLDDFAINKYMAKRMNLNEDDIEFIRIAGLATERYTNALKPYRNFLTSNNLLRSSQDSSRNSIKSLPPTNNRNDSNIDLANKSLDKLRYQKKSLSMNQRSRKASTESASDYNVKQRARINQRNISSATRAHSTSQRSSSISLVDDTRSSRASSRAQSARRPWKL